MSDIEECCICEDPTGRAGQADDSIYRERKNGEQVGPLCENCLDDLETRGELKSQEEITPTVQIDEKPTPAGETGKILPFWRLLEAGEVIQEGDEFWSCKNWEWEKFQIAIGSPEMGDEGPSRRRMSPEAVVKESLTTQVWAVVFSNYYPSEVDSLWSTEEGAKKRVSELKGDWRVECREVRLQTNEATIPWESGSSQEKLP